MIAMRDDYESLVHQFIKCFQSFTEMLCLLTTIIKHRELIVPHLAKSDRRLARVCNDIGAGFTKSIFGDMKAPVLIMLDEFAQA